MEMLYLMLFFIALLAVSFTRLLITNSAIYAVKVQNTPLVIQVETVRELLLHLDCHKSMGPDGLHPRVLRELVGVIAEPHLAI